MEKNSKHTISIVASELSKEVDTFCTENALDTVTNTELHFIANAFALFCTSHKNQAFRDVFCEFDNNLENVMMGIMGTSFCTNAPILYRELPSIKDALSKEVMAMTEELLALRKQVAEIPVLRKEIENLRKQIEGRAYEDFTRKNNAQKQSSKQSSRSYASYEDPCSRSSSDYGRC